MKDKTPDKQFNNHLNTNHMKKFNSRNLQNLIALLALILSMLLIIHFNK